jgi:hypothetical protein
VTQAAGVPAGASTGILTPMAAAQPIPAQVIAPLTGAAALATQYVPQPAIVPGQGGLFALPALNLPAVSGLGIPLPTQITMPTDMICTSPDWSAPAGPAAPGGPTPPPATAPVGGRW